MVCSSCDRKAYWVSRTVCICGATAPPGVLRRAKEQHAKAGGPKLGGGGGGKAGGTPSALASEMAAFRKQLEAIKVSLASAGGGGAKGTAAAQPAAEEPVDEDSERLAQISELESQIAKTKRLKLGDELVQAQETRLAALRAERMEAKAPQAQVAALSSRLGRLQAKQEKLRLAMDDKQKSIVEAQTALDQAKADLEAHQTDIANTASAVVAVQAELR